MSKFQVKEVNKEATMIIAALGITDERWCVLADHIDIVLSRIEKRGIGEPTNIVEDFEKLSAPCKDANELAFAIYAYTKLIANPLLKE